MNNQQQIKRKEEEEGGEGNVKKKKKANRSRGGPCGDSEVFSHSAHSASVAVPSLGTALLQDKD